jgi:transmembrane sensor
MTSDFLPFDPEDDADDEDRRAFVRLWTFLQRTDAEREASYDVDEEWEALADRLDLDAEVESDVSNRAAERRAGDRSARSGSATLSRRLQGWARGVAVAVLLVGLLGAGLWWGGSASVQTAPGERTVVTLPDGSTAELNGATTLTYPRGFNTLPWIGASAREVRLDGEAFFAVQNRDRPFRVETGNAHVEVLGTEFTVRARDEEGTPQTRVAVTAGRVRLQAAGTSRSSASVVLENAGQTSQVVGAKGRPTAPEVVDLKYITAWREGGFALSGAALPTVLRELEHRFGTTLRLTVPVATTDTMTLHYARDATLENVLHDVCLIQNLSYRKTSRGYELVRDDS